MSYNNMNETKDLLILKQSPEDFYVEELLANEWFEQNDNAKQNAGLGNSYNSGNPYKIHRLYRLEKINMSLKDVENIIYERIKTSSGIYFAGIKDKNAHTIQYFTTTFPLDDFDLTQPETDKENQKYLKVSFLGYTKQRLFIGANYGNKFRIKTNIFKDVKKICFIGTPNYFDEQRFQSKEFEKIVPAILKNDFETAIKEYLTRESKNPEINKMRNELKECWPNLNQLNLNTKDKLFGQNQHKQKMFDLIIQNDFANAFKEMNKLDLKLMYKQFQSLLWNKLLEQILQNQNPKQIVQDKFSNQPFPSQTFNIDKIRNHTLDLPNHNSNYKEYQPLFESILATYNLKQDDLNILPESKRDLFFFAKHLNQTKHKEYSILEFELPKGSYATLVIKQLYIINNPYYH